MDYLTLLEDLERLEWNNGQRVSSDLASHYQALRWSADPQLVELADRINIYYRNANVRLAISADLLNQLLPHEHAVDESVDDQLMGGRVLGRSRVTTRLRLVLMPDRERWRMGLEAQGDVNSRTQTKRGPARFHNAGRSHYLARKLLLIDRRGVYAGDAEATALTDADLTGMETDLDGVPLVNLLVRTFAKQMYDRQADEAQREAQGLSASRAESRLNQEVEEKLGTATSRFRREIWNPLRDLGLDPEAVDMETTSQRLIARYRLAGTDQVAAFTPRPQAPANSWLSIQVHESMLNNVIASLQLGGREMRLREMFLEAAHKLHRTQYQVPDDVPEDVTIQLAQHDPIRFECTDNRLHIVLRIRKLATDEGTQWDDFQVRGMYLPLVEGIHIGLQRDGYVHLKGERGRLPLRDQVALRTIFTKVLATKPDFDLLSEYPGARWPVTGSGCEPVRDSQRLAGDRHRSAWARRGSLDRPGPGTVCSLSDRAQKRLGRQSAATPTVEPACPATRTCRGSQLPGTWLHSSASSAAWPWPRRSTVRWQLPTHSR